MPTSEGTLQFLAFEKHIQNFFSQLVVGYVKMYQSITFHRFVDSRVQKQKSSKA